MFGRIKSKFNELCDIIRKAILSDNTRREVLFVVLNIALAVTALVMSIVNIFTDEIDLLFATLGYFIVCVLNVLLMKYLKIRSKTGIYISFGLESMALLIFFFISGIPNGFSALWVSLIPGFSMLIFGLKNGSLFSLTAFGVLAFLFWLPIGQSMLLYDYTDEFLLRFPFFYLAVYAISFLIELVRNETQKQLEEAKQQYRSLYRHDALTGLYNRYGINEFVNKAFSEKTADRVAVIMFDVDDFKSFNDVYGHEYGDIVLKNVAETMSSNICEHCRCCRWGGEEFIVLMQCDHNPAAVAEKIRKAIADLAPIEGVDTGITVSVGVCIAETLKDKTVFDVFDLADKAMYESKSKGKNTVTVYRI